MFTKFFILINIGLSSYILYLLLKESGDLPAGFSGITKSAETDKATQAESLNQPEPQNTLEQSPTTSPSPSPSTQTDLQTKEDSKNNKPNDEKPNPEL